MENVICIINSADLPAAVAIAKDLDDYKTYIFDPTLLETVESANLKNIILMNWDNCLDYKELERWSHATAFEIEKELDLVRSEIIPDISLHSWQHLNLHYLFKALRWYSVLWKDVIPSITNSIFYVFVCDNPSHNYFPSFIPSLLLLEYLTVNGIKFSAYTYGKKADETDVIPDLFEFDLTEHFEILAHIPTCFYDSPYFNEELKLSGKAVVNFQSKYWNISIDAVRTIGLTKVKSENDEFLVSLGDKSNVFYERITETLDHLLKPYIRTVPYRSRQSQYLARLYKSQMITYYLLEKNFIGQRPSKVLLSEHDAGFHGPIVSFAQNNDIPILLVPHSKTIGNIEFDGTNITSLSHPMQGALVSDRNSKRVRNFHLMYPESLVSSTSSPEKITKIGLLLNGLSLNGILFSRFASYIDGIKRISDWCKHNKIELGIRCRPGQSLINILARETGIQIDVIKDDSSGLMDDFVKKYDLYLMYDAPTSGAVKFLQQSIPILNPVIRDLSQAETGTTSSKVIPRASVETILDILDTFVSDNVNFHIFRITQFRNYVNLFCDSYPLRHFL